MRGASNEDKARVEERGKQLQAALKSQKNILVNQPKQNYGNSNDGNTARKFFADIAEVSRILGIYEKNI